MTELSSSPVAAPGRTTQAAASDATAESRDPELSVVVPVHNEAGNIEPLVVEILQALRPTLPFEIVYVDDGSGDATAAELAALRAAHPELRVVRHRARCGQSAAMRTGIAAARAAWVVTLDGDGQNDPADIPAMLAERDRVDGGAGNDGAGKDATARARDVLVAGVRARRQDSAAKRYASRLANRIRRWMLKDVARDSGCGLKLFPRQAFLDLPFFDHMHRYLPALFMRSGVALREIAVNHRPRVEGSSHYGIIDRGLVGLVDLLGVAWLQRRGARPVIEPMTDPDVEASNKGR